MKTCSLIFTCVHRHPLLTPDTEIGGRQEKKLSRTAPFLRAVLHGRDRHGPGQSGRVVLTREVQVQGGQSEDSVLGEWGALISGPVLSHTGATSYAWPLSTRHVAREMGMCCKISKCLYKNISSVIIFILSMC